MLNISTSIVPPPIEIKKKLPKTTRIENNILEIKSEINDIFNKSSSKLIIIVGPCSIHDKKSFLHYAKLFKKLANGIQNNILLVMRVFSEKSRTSLGWKGFLYDPYLNDSYNIEQGIIETRDLLLQLAEYKIPCAMEFVDPLVVSYLDDLISWGFIGARTSSSQPHRLFASAFDIPIGFKNATDGCLDVAINGMYTARAVHTYLGIAENGLLSKITSNGNPYSHLVLRGSDKSINFHPQDIFHAEKKIKKLNMTSKILIDCSHGNSKKDIERQKNVFLDVLKTYLKYPNSIIGMMLESFIYEGSQSITSSLMYGISVTDPCLDFKTTSELILYANEKIENAKLSYLP
jgi:3-deoxy-7-phosphoheptulonate synthase